MKIKWIKLDNYNIEWLGVDEDSYELIVARLVSEYCNPGQYTVSFFDRLKWHGGYSFLDVKQAQAFCENALQNLSSVKASSPVIDQPTVKCPCFRVLDY